MYRMLITELMLFVKQLNINNCKPNAYDGYCMII